jgi:Ca-activated chloride channel family protein
LLLLLVLVPPLVMWWLRGGEGAVRYSDTGLLRGLPSGREVWVRRAGAGLRAGALVLLVVALAGPRWPDPGTRIPTQGIAISMVVDTSASMAKEDFSWKDQPLSRLQAVQKAFRLLVAGGEGADNLTIQGRPSDLIALVTYGTRPETACPLTLNHGVLLEILDAQKPRTLITEATTNTGDALAWALHGLVKAPTKRKVLILLTDGEHNVGPPALTPPQAAQLAGNLGIPIYAIHAGIEPPPAKEPSGEDERKRSLSEEEEFRKAQKTLQKIANMTGGQYFRAGDTEALVQACNQIDGLERQEIQSFRYRRYFHAFAWFGLGSLLLWTTVHFLETTVWRKVP